MTSRLHQWILAAALVALLPGQMIAQGNGQVEPTKAHRYYQSAEEMINNVRYLDAAEQLQLALDEDPEFADARRRLAYVYTKMAESDADYYEDALEAYEELEVGLPDDVDIKKSKAFVYTRLDEFRSAIDTYEEIVVLAPEDCEAWGTKGGLHREMAKHEVEGSEEQIAYYDEALDAFRNLPESCPDKLSAYNTMGEILYGMGRTQEASDVYSVLLEQDPDNVEIAGRLGYLWYSAGQDMRRVKKDKAAAKELYKKAIPFLEKVMELEPERIKYLGLLANCYKHAGMYDKAAPAFLKVIESDESKRDQYCSLGFMYIDARQYEEAIAMAMKAISENAPQRGCLMAIWGKGLELRGLALEQQYKFSQTLSTYAEAKSKFTQALPDEQWGKYATKQISRIDQLIDRCRQLKLQDEQNGN